MSEPLTCDQMAPVDTASVTISLDQLKPDEYQFGKCCQICDGSFSVGNPYDPYVICPECRKRLNAMLYPSESEDSQKIG